MRFANYIIPLVSLIETAVALPLSNISKYPFDINPENFTIAAVRAAPINWPTPILNRNWTGITLDLNATVDYGVSLIEKAAADGANAVTFPECWFPGYPKGYDENNWMTTHIDDYIANSLEVGSENWNKLLQAAADNKVFVGFGFSEKNDEAIFMAQALIDPSGTVLIQRRKVRPSGSERLLWSDGSMSGLQVASTFLGRIGILECWEHFHPTMTFPMWSQTEDLHIASFPYIPDEDDASAFWWETAENNLAAARLYAINSGALTVVASVGKAVAFSAEGAVLAEMDASVSMEENPILYVSGINATAFNDVNFNINSEASWGILEEIVDNYPENIPRVTGNYVPAVTNPISQLLAA
ncbi:Nit1 protein [Martiniozyma asiatica (nom. inval.)]|nr:Nit1 protein [Martiniozyma asiatica]